MRLNKQLGNRQKEGMERKEQGGMNNGRGAADIFTNRDRKIERWIELTWYEEHHVTSQVTKQVFGQLN